MPTFTLPLAVETSSLATGQASLAQLVPVAPTPSVIHSALADLDGDGRMEILVQIGNLSALGATNRHVFSPVVHVLRAPDATKPYTYGP